MKLHGWDEAKIVAKALSSFLSKHCPSCGQRHTHVCMDGGRCVGCGASLSTVDDLADAVNQAKERLGV